MKNKTILLILIISSLVSNNLMSKEYRFTAHGKAEQSQSWQIAFTFSKTSGDWRGQHVSVYIPHFPDYLSDEGYNLMNTQYVIGGITTTTSTGNHIASYEEKNGVNYYVARVDIPSNFNSTIIQITIRYNTVRCDVKIPSVTNFTDKYPIDANLISFLPGEYLSYDDQVDINNEMTVAANTAASGTNSLFEVVHNVYEYILCNLTNKTVDPEPDDFNVASNVWYNGGDCDGLSHVMASMLRSLKIPVRITSGYVIRNKPSINCNGRIYALKDAASTTPVGHANCEVYFPSKGWVCFDPAQKTELFHWESYISTGAAANSRKFGFFTETTNFSANVSYTYPTISGKSATLKYIGDNYFSLDKNCNYSYLQANSTYSSGGSSTDIEKEPIAALKIFPNPSTDYLTIEVQGETSSEIKILTASGKTILTLVGTGKETVIDVKPLPAGIYIVKHFSTEGLAYAKFIKE
ncbi:MAG: T9SS type A sorting domain-containing protein [Chloroflexia bacterium]|nr:T9SS type A sorting domain-containing protein [Chloroflexia bacterium]